LGPSGCDDPLIRKAWRCELPEPLELSEAFPYVAAILRRMEGCRKHPMKVLLLGTLVAVGGILFLNLVGGDWNMWIMTFHIVGRIIPTDQYFSEG